MGQPAAPAFGGSSANRDCGPGLGGFPVLFRLGLPGTSTSTSSLPTTVANALHTAVSCGSLAVAGRQTVDGTDAIELKSRAGSLISETIWVSPSTYLPVRVIVRSSYARTIEQTADFTWLPPTTQNQAKLTVPVPAGFRKVSLPQAVTPNLKLIPGGAMPKPTFSPAGPAPFGSGLSVPRPAALCFMVRRAAC